MSIKPFIANFTDLVDKDPRNKHEMSLLIGENTIIIADFQRDYEWGSIFFKKYCVSFSTGRLQHDMSNIKIKEVGDGSDDYICGDGQQRLLSLMVLCKAMCVRIEESDEYDKSVMPLVEKFASNEYNVQGIAYKLTREKGVAGGISIKPRFKFPNKNMQKAYDNIMKPEALGEDIIEVIKRIKDGSLIAGDEQLLLNYMSAYESLKGRNATDLYHQLEEILKGTFFSVSCYSADSGNEMQKDYNMHNYVSKTLTEDALVKSYIVQQTSDCEESLRIKIIDDFNNKYQQSFYRSSSLTDKTQNHLSYYMQSFFNYRCALQKDYTNKSTLPNKYEDLLTNSIDMNFEDFINDFNVMSSVYEIMANDSSTYAKGTYEWWINYTAQALGWVGKATATPSLIMKVVKYFDNNDDIIKILSYLTTIYYGDALYNGKFNVVFFDFLLKDDVVLRNKTAEELIKWINNYKGTNGYVVPNANSFKQKIIDNYYSKDSKTSAIIVGSIIHYLNIQAMGDEDYGSLIHAPTPGSSDKYTREHIAPINPKNTSYTLEQKAVYDSFNGKIGNFVVLKNSINSSIKNNSVEDKIMHYTDTNPRVNNELKKVVEYYKDNNGWTNDSIAERTKLIAHELSSVFSADRHIGNIDNREKINTFIESEMYKNENILIKDYSSKIGLYLHNKFGIDKNKIILGKQANISRDIKMWLNEDYVLCYQKPFSKMIIELHTVKDIYNACGYSMNSHTRSSIDDFLKIKTSNKQKIKLSEFPTNNTRIINSTNNTLF